MHEMLCHTVQTAHLDGYLTFEASEKSAHRDSQGLIISFMPIGTSPPCYSNSAVPTEGDGKELDLNESDLRTCDETAPTYIFRSQFQETRPTLNHIEGNEEPWSPLNPRVGNSSSRLHRLLFRHAVREQIHAIGTPHDGGPLVSHPSCFNGYHSMNIPLSSSATAVDSIPQCGRRSESDPVPRSVMPLPQDDQFEEASSATYGRELSPEQLQDSSRSISQFDGCSEMESTFEPETSQDNMISRSNEMLITPGQGPTNHASHLAPLYGYHPGLNLSYRQYLDNYRSRCLPYYKPRGAEYQTQHSNSMASLTWPPNIPLRRSPSHNTMEHSLDGVGVGRSVVGPVRRTARGKGAKGIRQGPLANDVRAHARDTRGEGSCWPCKIQRYKVRFCKRIVEQDTYPF